MHSTRLFQPISRIIKEPGLSKHIAKRIFSTSAKAHNFSEKFFLTTRAYNIHKPSDSIDILKDKTKLTSFFSKLDKKLPDNYLYSLFIGWTNAYARNSATIINDYFNDGCSLDDICRDFIRFCFSQNVFLDPQKTLESFTAHNILSDNSVKDELSRTSRKPEINLLGFGLDNGSYEKSLADYLIQNNITSKVNVFGFDPYANKSSDITYLSPQDLANFTHMFDIIVARWVLHHVELKNRWSDLTNCINKASSNAKIIIVEHGFLEKEYVNEKLFYFLNSTFDIIANIGLRPTYFTSTAPNIGANFFIKYLKPIDFNNIEKNSNGAFKTNYKNVGPFFPNQTICCITPTPSENETTKPLKLSK